MTEYEKRSNLIKQGLIPDWLDRVFYISVTPLIRLFSMVSVNPNWLTFTGFSFNVFAGYLIVRGYLFWAAIFIGLAGIFDFIDGKVARALNKKTRFGAIFDSVLDRYSDIIIYMALCLYYYFDGFIFTAFASITALCGSVLTSYVKAVGESHGISFRTGAMRRQERITLIFAGLILCFAHRPLADFAIFIFDIFNIHLYRVPTMPLAISVYLLSILTNITAFQRFFTLLRISRKTTED